MLEHPIMSSMILSAKQYYDYLSKKNKGNEIIEAIKIVRVNSREIKIHLAKKLFTPEEFSLSVNRELYSSNELKVTDYDIDLKILTIIPPEDVGNHISNTALEKIYVVCDLKFLVDRVKKWYEWCRDNNYIVSLENRNRINNVSTVISQPQIDKCQKEAVNSTLTSPVSYVWGAPGTGKTRYVLANSVLSHIKNNDRVLVIAPTNNSLEQSLYGIIEVLEAQGVSTNDILRLGIPSHKFASTYPECCESAGITKKITELNKTIESLYKQKQTVRFYARYRTLTCDIIPAVQKLSEIVHNLNDILEQIKYKEDKIKNIEILLNKENQREPKLAQSIRSLEKQSKSFVLRILKNKKQTVDNELSELYAELKKCIDSQHNYTKYKNSLQNEIAELKPLIDYSIANNVISEIHNTSVESERIQSLISSITTANCDEILDALFDLEREGKSALDEMGFYDYDLSVSDVELQISNYQTELSSINEVSTEHRLQKVKVIAATIDRFVSSADLVSSTQRNSEYKINHVYLDEAGYCCLIKGLALFACNVPITLLGDHMQLPPVCEANEKDYNKYLFLWSQSILAAEDIFKYSLEEAFVRYKEAYDFKFDYINKSDLTVTYRFGTTLSSILNAYVYKNGFKSADTVDNLTIIAVDAPKKDGQKNRENIAEVNAIKNLINDYDNKDYVILTPYRNQLTLLNQELPKIRQEQKAMTIHASQGREFDTVILSVVDKSNPYFTDSTKKQAKGLYVINTAVSRAKKELIIVCDKEHWSKQNHQLITEIINSANK